MCAGLLAALLFVCAVCGAGSSLPKSVKDTLPDAVREAVTPVTAQAAGGDPAMVMGTSSVLGQTGDYNSSKANTQVVWYNEKSWYVIGYNRSGVASAADSMTLFATGILKDNVQFNPDSNLINEYSGSNLKTQVESIASGFTAGEQAAITSKELTGNSGNYGSGTYNGDHIAGNTVSGAMLWPLSLAEANQISFQELREAGNFWWLRSPGDSDINAALVTRNGDVRERGYNVDNPYGVRPAFNLNLSSVIFTSAAVGGKSCSAEGTADALTAVSAMSSASSSNVNEWKLTLNDSSRSGFNASTTSYDSSTGVLQFTYSGQTLTAANDYISVIIVNSSGAITYYGRIVDNSATGNSASVNLSSKINTGDKVYAFNEQVNNDKETDYSSGLKELQLSTSATVPSITTVSLPSGRVGDTYTATLSASGTAPITWSATGLAAGLSINSTTGEISGTPTKNGTINVSVTATNTTGSDTKQLTLTINPASGPAPTPTPAQNPSDPCATGHAKYHWITVRAADEHNDGEMVYLCSSCGHERYRVPISGYSIFSKNTMQKILDAPQGATISVSTRRWISFHRMVYQALADRPDVTLKISFLDGGYRGNRYSVTIPAGYDTLSLLNGTDYCGFLYLGSKFGLSPGK